MPIRPDPDKTVPFPGWLDQPASPKMVLSIFAILITAFFGPMTGALLAFGNTSVAAPVWSGSQLAGCTLALWGACWLRSRLVAAVCFALLFMIPAMTLLLGMENSIFWPSRLLVQPWPASLLPWFLALVWLALVILIPLSVFRTGAIGTDAPSSARAKKWRFVIPAVAAGLVLSIVAAINTEKTIRNLAYFLAGMEETQHFSIDDKKWKGRSGRFQTGADIVLALKDEIGHIQHVLLDDFYRREVQIFRKSDPARAKAMFAPWNQIFCPGDRIAASGRNGPMGFAIDSVSGVIFTDTGECAQDRR